MSLKPYGTRPSDDGNRDDDIYIVEAEVGTSFDRTYEYTYSGSGSSYLTGSGTNQTNSTANIEFITLSLLASGENTTSNFAVLAEPLNISASGLSSTEKVANFGIIYDINANGLSATQTSVTLSRAKEIIASADASGTVETSLLAFLISLTSSGKGIGDGFGGFSTPIIVNGSGIGEGQYASASLAASQNISSKGEGKGTGSSNATVQTYSSDQLSQKDESFLVGNTEIPLLISKNTSTNRDTIIKDFVDKDSEVFQDNQNLESGTYSAFLNPENHSQDKSIEEQMEDVRALLNRTPQSNEIEYTDGTAYLAVQSISDVIDVNPNLREVELDVIVLESI